MAAMLTTSWDDGHPLDLRLASMLAAHGFRGTFYVPRRNVEGRDVLSTTQLRELASGFEIGGHTLDHVRLDRMSTDTADDQIRSGKQRLEEELGQRVVGFCYPGGVHNHAIRRAVRDAGFRYARTITNFHTEAPADRFRVPTTIQLYPHARTTYAKNFVSGGDWNRRSGIFAIALSASRLDETLRRILDRTISTGGVFHLWGHSWELEQHNLWGVLDAFLRAAAGVIPKERRVDNATAYALR